MIISNYNKKLYDYIFIFDKKIYITFYIYPSKFGDLST